MDKEYEMVKFKDGAFELDVKADFTERTVWLNVEEMASLFDVDRTSIAKHISKIYRDKELKENETCMKSGQVRIEGGRQVTRRIASYNLDMIIFIGFKVKSERGILFRRWADNVLIDHLVKGYTVNSKRMEVLGKTIEIQC